MLAETPGSRSREISKDVERDKYLTAEDALEYGIIDEVLTSMKDSSNPTSTPVECGDVPEMCSVRIKGRRRPRIGESSTCSSAPSAARARSRSRS